MLPISRNVQPASIRLRAPTNSTTESKPAANAMARKIGTRHVASPYKSFHEPTFHRGTGNACKKGIVRPVRSPLASHAPMNRLNGTIAINNIGRQFTSVLTSPKGSVIPTSEQVIAAYDTSFHLCSCHSFQARLCHVVRMMVWKVMWSAPGDA